MFSVHKREQQRKFSKRSAVLGKVKQRNMVCNILNNKNRNLGNTM